MAQVVGAGSVVSGVILMNTLEQAGVKSKPAMLASAVLFVGGWVSFANGAAMLTAGEVRRIAIVGLCALIAVSAFVLRSNIKAGKTPSPVAMFGFFSGWLGLALVMGSARGRYLRPMTGAVAAAGGMALLPWQRRLCLVDGPAMPLFTLGWVLLATTLR